MRLTKDVTDKNLPPCDESCSVIWGNCRSVSTAIGFVTWISWSHAWLKSGNNSNSRSLTKRSNSGVSIFESAFENAEDILNTNFRQAYCSIFLQRHSLTFNCLHHCLYWTLRFLSAYTKTTICSCWQILLKFCSLFAMRCCIVAAKFRQNTTSFAWVVKKYTGGYFFSEHSIHSRIVYCYGRCLLEPW